jgi:hypothetical protein
VLMEEAGELHWVEASAGNLIEIPGNSKHAVRNRSEHPAITLLYHLQARSLFARSRPIRCLWRKRRTAGRNAAFSEDGEALWLLVCDSGRERSRWY